MTDSTAEKPETTPELRAEKNVRREKGTRLRTETTPRLRAGGAGYTWFVKIARLTLPIAALVIIGIVIARLSIDPQQQNITALPQKEKTSAGQIEIENARYEGVDTEGRAYSLSAKSASRDPASPDRVFLAAPKADVTLQSGQWVAITADNGTYDLKESRLTLEKKVSLFHDGGYQMTMDAAQIDMAKGEAHSSGPVKIQGPEAILSAQNMRIEKSGALITFGGPATVTIHKLQRGAKG